VKVEFEKSFMRDLKKISSKVLLRQVKEVIKNVEDSENMNGLENLKRLKTDTSCFRIKVSDYRIGLKLKGETIIFIRILHRKDIYRHFP